MAEWSNAVVLKTIVPQGTGGSNPSLSALIKVQSIRLGFFYLLANINIGVFYRKDHYLNLIFPAKIIKFNRSA